ncbi:MAG: hypothetical protein ACR2KL_01410 [Nocardioidaceae bacterium]
MAPLIDMNVQQVYSAGTNVSGMSGQAASVARSFLTALDDASGTVVHATVSAALNRYHATWSQPANRMSHDVDALGQDTAGSAVDIATGDANATAALQPAALASSSLAGRLNTGRLSAG